MSRWYRAYEGTCADPKLHEAAAVAGVSRSVVIAVWHIILESCASNEGIGEFEIPPRRIAVILGETVDAVESVLTALGDVGLIGDGCVPNWNKRQFVSDRDPTNATRQARYRETKKHAASVSNAGVTPRNGPVTPPIDRDINIERKEETLSGSRKRSPDRAVEYPDDFLLLWESFPRHPNASKHEACKAWRRLPPDQRDACLDGAMAYSRFLASERAKRPDYPALHLATFINQRRFESLNEAERAQCVN